MFQNGDQIRFRYTGAKAKILNDFLDGSYRVLLMQDNDEIIAFRDDIVLEKDFKGIEKSIIEQEIGVKKIKLPSTEELFYSKDELKKKKEEKLKQNLNNTYKEEHSKEIDKEYFVPVFKETAPKNSGVWLAFAEQAHESYIIYIINDSNYSFSFEFELSLNGKIEQKLKQHISPYNYFALAEFESAMLNDIPKISLNFPIFKLNELLNLKYKKWISMQQEVPIIGINCRAHLVLNVSRFENLKTNGESDLSKYTKDQLKKSEKVTDYTNKLNKAERLAHFNKELDLHAEILIPNYRNLISREILERQKIELEKYLAEAIELGASEVFIIHGLGEGVLRKTVENYLIELKGRGEIQSFSNNYFAKYGYGATIVRI